MSHGKECSYLHRLTALIFRFMHSVPPSPAIFTLSLHGRSSDLSRRSGQAAQRNCRCSSSSVSATTLVPPGSARSSLSKIGRATSELQSRGHLVCRLLLEKKKNSAMYRF